MRVKYLIASMRGGVLMTNKKIIVISGKQFSGKDTVANLVSEYMHDFQRIGLADALKAEFGKEKDITLDEIERNKPLYRSELIALGNKRRSEDPDFWIKKVLETDSNIIVSDVRLLHELETFRKKGAITVRVESNREERAKRGHLVSEDDQTETALDGLKDWDYVIENNSSLEDLVESSKKVAKAIEKTLYSSSK